MTELVDLAIGFILVPGLVAEHADEYAQGLQEEGVVIIVPRTTYLSCPLKLLEARGAANIDRLEDSVHAPVVQGKCGQIAPVASDLITESSLALEF